MKYEIIVADPPFSFSDGLKQSKTKRSAEDQYDVMNNKDIINLDVKSIAADNSVLALWVPSSLVKEGIQAAENWGFKVR